MWSRLTVVAGIGLFAAGCTGDPPDDGFLFISFLADNTGQEDVSELGLTTSGVEVLLSDTPTGEQRRVPIPNTAGKNIVLTFGPDHHALATATLGVPKGFVHQVRFIANGVEVRGSAAPGGSALAKLPSGPQTGLKINPASGVPFEIVSKQTTRISVQFTVADQLNRPKGIGFLFKPTLEAELAQDAAEAPFTAGEAVVRFNAGVTQADIDGVITGFDSRATIKLTVDQSIKLFVVAIPDDRSLFDAIEYFGSNSKVYYTLPSIPIPLLADNPRPSGSPNDPSFSSQPEFQQVSAPTAWDRQVGSMNVIVAVFDTGIDLTHPDIVNNLFFNVGEIPTGVTIVDADSDGVITFRDLNDPQNAGVVMDSNGNGFIDGVDVLALRSAGGLADGVDNDAIPGDPTNVTDDLVGARIGRFPASGGAIAKDNKVADDQVATATFPINGHGTAVAGLIGAQGNNGKSIAGLNWNIRILPVKACDGVSATPACDTTLLMTSGMRYARRMGATLGNFSLGVAVTDPNATAAKVKRIITDPGNKLYQDGLAGGSESMLMVLAAGNTGMNCDLVTSTCFPAELAIPDRIVVAAVDNTDSIAAFSEFGPTVVDIAAPGVALLSLDRVGGTQSVSGTSFAAPMVVGAAALMTAQRLPATFTTTELRARILNAADPLAGLTTKTNQGRRLNVSAAVNAAAAP